MKRTVKNLAKAIIAGLDAKYDLVFINQGDKLMNEQVAALVNGDYEKLWDSTEEFESDAMHSSIDEILRTNLDEVIAGWEREDDKYYGHLKVKFLDSKHARRGRRLQPRGRRT